MSSILFPGFQRFLLRERYRFSPGSGPKETGSQHRLGAYVVVSLLAGVRTEEARRARHVAATLAADPHP